MDVTLERGDGVLGVEIVRRCDEDRIHQSGVEQRVGVVKALDSVSVDNGFYIVRNSVTGRGELEAWYILEGPHVAAAHASATDYA